MALNDCWWWLSLRSPPTPPKSRWERLKDDLEIFWGLYLIIASAALLFGAIGYGLAVLLR